MLKNILCICPYLVKLKLKHAVILLIHITFYTPTIYFMKLNLLLFFMLPFIAFAQQPANNIEKLRIQGYNLRFTDTARSIAFQQKALQIAKLQNNRQATVISYATLSFTYRKFAQIALCQLYADSAFVLAEKIQDTRSLGYANMAAGLIKSYLDDAGAAALLINAYSLFKTINDNSNVTKVAAELSYLFGNNDIIKKEKYALIAIEAATQTNDPEYILYGRLAYGSLLISKKRKDKELAADTAINYFKNTIILLEHDSAAISTKSNLATAYLNLAVLYSENEFPHSEPLFLNLLDKAQRIAQQYNIKVIYRNSLGLKGEYFLAKDDFLKAENLFKEGIAYQNSLPFADNATMATFYASLKNVAAKQKNFLTYYQYDTLFVKYNNRSLNEASIKSLQNADARFESVKKADKILWLENENKLQNTNKWLGYGIAILLFIGLLFGFRSYYFRQRYYLQSEAAAQQKQVATQLQLQLKEQQAVEALMQKISMERRLLQSQMDPHFVFNALGNIQSFVLQNDTQNAVSYLATFSKLMRQVLSQSKSQSIPIADEISTLTNYIELQKLRLNHNFIYSIMADNMLDVQSRIPPMLVQPFIENAIEHGLKPLNNKQGKLHVFFKDDEVNNCLVCTVTDNGVGYGALKQPQPNIDTKHQSLATAITLERMQQMEKENAFAGFAIQELKDEDGIACGTEVIINIPYYKP